MGLSSFFLFQSIYTFSKRLLFPFLVTFKGYYFLLHIHACIVIYHLIIKGGELIHPTLHMKEYQHHRKPLTCYIYQNTHRQQSKAKKARIGLRVAPLHSGTAGGDGMGWAEGGGKA